MLENKTNNKEVANFKGEMKLGHYHPPECLIVSKSVDIFIVIFI